MSIYEKQNIDLAFPKMKQTLIEYAEGQYIEALQKFNIERDNGEQRRKANIYSEELGDVKNFPELKEEILKRISRIVSEYLDYVGTRLSGMSREKIEKLKNQVDDAHFELSDDVNKTFETVQQIVDKLEKELAVSEQEAIEKMENITREQPERKSSRITEKLKEKMELSGGKPVTIEVNGQEVVATQETIINSTTNKLETVYMCRSPKASEALIDGENNIIRLGYDGWVLCLTEEEHNEMFPEVAAITNEFITKYADKSHHDVEESMEDIATDSAENSIEEEKMESIVPQNMEEEKKEPQIIERDGKKYVIVRDTKYDENGNLLAQGELRTLDACNPAKLQQGFVSLNKGTYNVVLTPDEYKDVILAMEHSQSKSYDRKAGEMNK